MGPEAIRVKEQAAPLSKSESIESRCLLVFYDSNKANHHTFLTLFIQINNHLFQ